MQEGRERLLDIKASCGSILVPIQCGQITTKRLSHHALGMRDWSKNCTRQGQLVALRMRRVVALDLKSAPPTRRWNLLGPGAFLPSFRASRTNAAVSCFLAVTLPQ